MASSVPRVQYNEYHEFYAAGFNRWGAPRAELISTTVDDVDDVEPADACSGPQGRMDVISVSVHELACLVFLRAQIGLR